MCIIVFEKQCVLMCVFVHVCHLMFLFDWQSCPALNTQSALILNICHNYTTSPLF